MKAYLILEDGHVFEGEHFGDDKEIISEFVFNTAMSGYVEVLSDPSYAGQSVVMTYPLIGNYGVCLDDQESNQTYVSGLVVNELSRVGSHFRKNMELEQYCIEHQICGIQGIDTRYVTQLIRNQGCMNGMITTHYDGHLEALLPLIQSYTIKGEVDRVTCQKPYTVGSGLLKVALYDFGAKRNIIQELVKRGAQVTVYPAKTPAKIVLQKHYDGIMLSNGPGNPQEEKEIINEIKTLIKSQIPIFAICLGHQFMALAHGFETEKLKFGHHGSNHPIQDMKTQKVYITTQNHNFVVKEDSIDHDVARVWFKNVNDGTVEGLEYYHENILTVQFHPEACAGPLDTNYLFDDFMNRIGGNSDAKK